MVECFLVISYWECVSEIQSILSLYSAKPLSEPMLLYCWLDPKEGISVKLKNYHSKKCTWKCHLENGGHFVSASMC